MFTAYRPLEKLDSRTLTAVVNRGKYIRFGKDVEAILQQELAVRRLEERRYVSECIRQEQLAS